MASPSSDAASGRPRPRDAGPAGALLRSPDAGLTLSMAALAAVALAGVWAAQRGSRASQASPGGPQVSPGGPR